MTRAIGNLFAQVARMVSEEAIELTLASLRAYWGEHEHVAIAWSGAEPSAALWLDKVNQDGSIEPILFRDLVGQ